MVRPKRGRAKSYEGADETILEPVLSRNLAKRQLNAGQAAVERKSGAAAAALGDQHLAQAEPGLPVRGRHPERNTNGPQLVGLRPAVGAGQNLARGDAERSGGGVQQALVERALAGLEALG